MSLEFDQDFLTGTYTDLYSRSEVHDSPQGSRYDLLIRTGNLLTVGIHPHRMLDIGSGRQLIEKELHRFYRGYTFLNGLTQATLDIANISSQRLLAKQETGVAHFRGSGLTLPFADQSFGLVVSNLAIDFLPHEVFSEVSRVLAPGGQAAFNFHHPSLTENFTTHPQVAEFWQYLDENHILFSSQLQIRSVLEQHGLEAYEINLDSDGNNKWWSVNASRI